MEIKKVAIIGSGTMGAGIAQWFLQQNIKVELLDQNDEQLKIAYQKIIENLDLLVSKNKINQVDAQVFKLNLKTSTIDTISDDVNLVIEAIIEDLNKKQELFKILDSKLPLHCIFSTNTSSIPITEIASNLSDLRRKNFIGLHFFNPATIMKLVEVINGIDTNREHCDFFINFFNVRNKIAVMCSDRPGFIVNRIARNFYGESMRIIENYDLEKIKEVDRILKLVGGFKMGPFELMDLIGIDINYSVTESVYKAFFDEPRFRPHKLQKEMVQAKRLGKKSNRGFYEYK